MMHRRYTGQFISRAGVVWRVDIMQDAASPYPVVGELEFPAEEPLVIEWQREDKEEVVCGSVATLKVVSPGDRTYADLYTIAVGKIRLDVYRGGAIYWSGTIDPEFYEEPYESLRGYEVSLTFSDFGILDRIKYDLSGMQTLEGIIGYALERAGIQHSGLDVSHVTTTFTDNSAITGWRLSVRSDNFFDEDGEPSTLYEVLEGILQPLAIRIIQRAGKVYLYDLNGLYTRGTAAAIEWDGDSQTMGTDKVANNVTVSFSPYSSASLLDGELEYVGKYDVAHHNKSNTAPTEAGYGEYYSYYPDYSDDHKVGGDWDYNLIDFTIFLSQSAKGLKSIGPTCRYFHILPVTGSTGEASGVAYAFRTGGHGSLSSGYPAWKVNSGIPHAALSGNSEVLTSQRVFLPALDETSAKKYKVRVAQELLLDTRYNPFSGSEDGNEKSNTNTFKTCSAFVFIPARITLYDDAGNAIYHYRNVDGAADATIGHLGNSRGVWAAGADPGGACWLEYYNPSDLKEDTGLMGWKSNRHCIGRPDGKAGRIKTKIYDSFAKMADGEYMPYPPAAGWLEVQIQAGVLGYDHSRDVDDCPFGSSRSQWDVKGMYDRLRWCLYKAPVVDVVNNNLAFDEAELEDIEYSGYINVSAREDIGIDTVCGTSTDVCPTARGIYHRASSGQQIQQLRRAGRTDHPERLLIGTLYSQYADRKTTLAGEAVMDGGLHYYTEANQPGKRFLLLSDVQDVITDTTDALYCEFRPDEYDPLEI
jgi:hypothetical protein